MMRTETGQIPADILGIAGDAAAGILGASQTQAALNKTIATSLQSTEVRAALRPLYLEAALYAAAAVAVGGLAYSLIRRII